MDRTILVVIGKNIKKYRLKCGLTQEQLAEKANMSAGFLSQIEAPNMVMGLSLATVFAIAEALQVPPSKLLEFE